jgi:polysaccharide export outer membrane protein
VTQTIFRALWVLVATGMLVAAGCRTPGVSIPPGPPSADVEPYVIGAPDLLRITVWKHPDLSSETPVRRDGKISVPLLSDVQAAGLTPEQLRDVIRKELAGFVSRPDVTVTVVSPQSHAVMVVGAVVNSGSVPIERDMSVLEAIAAAGGFNSWANKSDVRVIRRNGEERVSYRFDYRAYLEGAPDSDILLKPGDVVVVTE